MTDVTQILSQIESGDPIAAEQPLVYEELQSWRPPGLLLRSPARRCRRPRPSASR
jgi:hypothetical protein